MENYLSLLFYFGLIWITLTLEKRDKEFISSLIYAIFIESLCEAGILCSSFKKKIHMSIWRISQSGDRARQNNKYLKNGVIGAMIQENTEWVGDMESHLTDIKVRFSPGYERKYFCWKLPHSFHSIILFNFYRTLMVLVLNKIKLKWHSHWVISYASLALVIICSFRVGMTQTYIGINNITWISASYKSSDR